MPNGSVSAHHYATGQPIQITWKDGRITAVSAIQQAPRERWVAPALVDLQVNGYGGIDFQQDQLPLQELLAATRRLRADGCGQYLLTLVTDEWPRLIARLRHYQALRAQSPELQQAISGWHIEGPFLSAEPGFCGAHDPKLMIDPAPEFLSELRETVPNDPLLLTLAPERPEALEAISTAVELGIVVSLGHTNAPLSVLSEAVSRGARGFTHLGNGCPRELDRHDNILWRVFETDGLTIGVIPDSIHVSPALFRLIHHLVPGERIYYTTDAMSAAGMKPGRYRLGRLELEVKADGIVRLPGSSNFAGSALRPIEGLFRAARMLNCSWRALWDRASLKPAAWMGLPIGELTLGAPADFCLLELSEGNELKSWEMIPAAAGDKV